MAFIRCDFYSDVLEQSTSMNVILPEGIKTCNSIESNFIDNEFPVLYLLHGYNGDETVWFRFSAIERYAGKYPLAIVMPRANHSFFVDSQDTGYNYFTFITEELPKKVRQFFNVSSKREDTFIAGLSMGGYGAMHAALGRPDLYAAAAALSGFLDPGMAYEEGIMRGRAMRVLGEDLSAAKQRGNDIITLLKKCAGQNPSLPLLYITCGTEDQLYRQNLSFKAACDELKIQLEYNEQSGIHDWVYWDRTIADVLAWLPIKKR